MCTRTFSKNNKGKDSYTWLSSYLWKFQGSLVSKDPSSLPAWPRPLLPTLTSYPQIRPPASTLPCCGPRIQGFPSHVARPPAQSLVPSLPAIPPQRPDPVAATRVPSSSWASFTLGLPEPSRKVSLLGTESTTCDPKTPVSSPALSGYMHLNPGRPAVASGAQGPKMTEEDTPPPWTKRRDSNQRPAGCHLASLWEYA